MTDRYQSFTVILEQPIRADDAEALLLTLRQIRGVASVEPDLADPGQFQLGAINERRRIMVAIAEIPHD